MVLISQEATRVISPKEYTDKQISVLRSILNNNVVSMEAVFSKIKQLEDQIRILKLEQEVLVSENKELKQDIHVIKCNAKAKQVSLEAF